MGNFWELEVDFMAEKTGQIQKIKIENVVASTDIKKIISLDKLLNVLESSEYEPEQFPGLVYRIYDPKVAFLLFSSGRVVCAGAKSLDSVKKAVAKLEAHLKALKSLNNKQKSVDISQSTINKSNKHERNIGIVDFISKYISNNNAKTIHTLKDQLIGKRYFNICL